MTNCHKNNGRNNATDLNGDENGFIFLIKNVIDYVWTNPFEFLYLRPSLTYEGALFISRQVYTVMTISLKISNDQIF